MTRRPVPLIVNPAAGNGRALRSAQRARAVFELSGVRVDLHPSRSPDDSAALARAFALDGHPTVIACGGDGTVSRIANGVARTETALAVVPAGRGNDFARAIGMPPRDADAAKVLAHLLRTEHPAQPIDLGEIDGRYFCTVAAIGLDAAVSARVQTSSRGRGRRLPYLTSAIAEVLRYEPCLTHVSGDFGEHAFSAFVCAVANTRGYGGLFRIAPNASLVDGLFDVCMVDAAPTAQAILLMFHAMRGTHVHDARVTVVRSSVLRIRSTPQRPLYADGEFLADTPAELQIAAGALRVLVPPSALPV